MSDSKDERSVAVMNDRLTDMDGIDRLTTFLQLTESPVCAICGRKDFYPWCEEHSFRSEKVGKYCTTGFPIDGKLSLVCCKCDEVILITKVKSETEMSVEITKEKFEAYEDIRTDGLTNMWDTRMVAELSDGELTSVEALEVIKNYTELCEKYPEVRSLDE